MWSFVIYGADKDWVQWVSLHTHWVVAFAENQLLHFGAVLKCDTPFLLLHLLNDLQIIFFLVFYLIILTNNSKSSLVSLHPTEFYTSQSTE